MSKYKRIKSIEIAVIFEGVIRLSEANIIFNVKIGIFEKYARVDLVHKHKTKNSMLDAPCIALML